MSDELLRELAKDLGDVVEARSAPERVIDFQRYRDDPVGFVTDVLKVEHLWEAQREYLRAVAEHPRVAAYGANGCSKSFTDSCIALWWVYCRDGLVVATSTREGQLRDSFMRDVSILFHQAEDLAGSLYQLDLRRPSHPLTGIHCRAAGTPSGLRSQHAPNMMVQLQECQGLEDWAFTTAEMMAVGKDDRITATGNCDLGPVGPFYRVCRLASWKQVRFNAMLHPNILESRVVIPGGPTIESINQRAADYGVDSGFYTSSVLGEFPANATEGLIQAAWLERAFALHERGAYLGYCMRGQLVFGVDVARHGADRSVVCAYHGRTVREFAQWQGCDLMVSAARVMEVARRYGVRPVLPVPAVLGMTGDPLLYEPNTHRAVIRVDTTGLGGGCYDALIHQHWPCEEFISASSPITERNQERFLNRRAEAFFELRAKLEAGELAIPRSNDLMRELTAITWSVNGTGRIVIERKQDIKAKLGGASSDFADALAMAVTIDAGVIDFGSVNLGGPIAF